jgi:thymidine phosphorylase
VIDVPVGPTAKVRTQGTAIALVQLLEQVGRRVGLLIRTVMTDGSQPVGRGIGPALEARDVLAVLRNDRDAPHDLREHALQLAGQILELVGASAHDAGRNRAAALLREGAAWRKFQSICEAQGGMKTPPTSAHRADVAAADAGTIVAVDNRRLARTAKLAGAPGAAAAGVDFHVRVGDTVERGQPLFTVHAESPGELAYASEYLTSHPDIVSIGSRS